MSQPPPSKLARAGRILAAAAMCAIGAGILAYSSAHNAEKSDFISYWAAGQQLVHRLNPYDAVAIARIQHQAGYGGEQAFFMRNAPWAFFLALPLGFASKTLASFLWSCAILISLAASVRLFWARVTKYDENLRLFSYIFAPAVFCLLQQQIGIFLLLGFVLFLYWVQTRPLLAGAALLLPALKPHLTVPFWIALLLWAITQRWWRVLGGLVIAMATSLALAFALDPACFQHYNAMMRSANIRDDFIPSVAQLLRLSIDHESAWLQLVPVALACVWTLWYFRKHSRDWDWAKHGSVVLLVSVAAAPYVWFADQSILLVAIMCGFAIAGGNRRIVIAFAVLTSIAFAELWFGVSPRSWGYIWTTPGWLLWYLYATRNATVQPIPTEAAPA